MVLKLIMWLSKNKQLIPIQVKWTETPGNAVYQHLSYFMEIYNIKIGKDDWFYC